MPINLTLLFMKHGHIHCKTLRYTVPSLGDPYSPLSSPPKKKNIPNPPRESMAGKNWERPTNSTWRSDPWHKTTATIAPIGGSKPQAFGKVGRRISGYVKWSEFAVSAWRGWRYWLYDDDFPRTYKASCIFWLGGCMYFIQGVGYLKLTRIKNVKGLRVQRQTVWNS